MTLVLRDSLESWSSWQLGGAASSIVAGRTANGGQLGAGTTATWYFNPPGSNAEYVTIGFGFRSTDLTGGGSIVTFMTSSITAADNLGYNANGSLYLQSGASGPILGTTAAGLIVANTFAYVEAQIRFHATLGTVILRVNGTEVLNLDAINTGGANERLRLNGASALRVFDDFYIKRDAGETLLGPIAITEARDVRQAMRVGFTESMTVDWYRDFRQSLRVAFQGADVAARLAGFNLRVLRAGTGGNARLGGYQLRVLRAPGTPVVLAPTMSYWTGSAFDTGPLKWWSGSAFEEPEAVKMWNGTAFVDV